MPNPELVFFLFSLLGAFATLLWLRPGKRAAARYALIVFSFAALCYLLSDKAQPSVPHLLLYIVQAMPVLVFLLGVFMLRCAWRRVVLSLGIYVPIAALASLANPVYPEQQDELRAVDLLFSFSTYLEVLWIWFFIWLCTRKDATIRPSVRVLAAAAYTGIALLVLRIANYAEPYVALAAGPKVATIIIPAAVYLLCLGGMLRYVLQQPWKRSLCTAGAVVVIWLVAICSAQYLLTRAFAPQSLTKELIVSIEENNLSSVKNCLQQGADVNKPLHDLAENGEWQNFYPIIHATALGRDDMVKVLLDAGADVHVRRAGGDTALLSACIYNGEHDNTELVRLLLQAGSDVNAANDNGDTPLLTATLTNAPASVTKLLLEAGAYVNRKNNEGDTPLHFASLPENPEAPGEAPEVMRMLLTHGAQVNARDIEGDTPLLQCARDGFTEGVRLLLEYGADPSLRNNAGKSPLDYAVENTHTEIADMLQE